VHRATEVELDVPAGELVGDRAGIGQRAGEPVELGDDELVAGATRRQGFAEARAGTGRAAQPVVDVDALGLDPEGLEAVALGGEVLGVGGDARVADQQSGTPNSVPFVGRSPAHITEPVLRHILFRAAAKSLLSVTGVPV
jgi:hypothetical protein